MSALLDLTAPLLICCVLLAGVFQGVDIYAGLIAGAKKGLRICAELLPALVILFPAVWLLRASGLPALIGRALTPLLTALGIPPETSLLVLLRPISGSGALSAAAELIDRFGPDSLAGRTAAVMIGSSETTLYVSAVYFAAAGVKKSRWAVPAALCADLACFVSSAWVCRLLWG